MRWFGGGDEEELRFAHLPLGRDPGPQSVRTRKRRNLVGPLLTVAGFGMYGTGVWMVAGGRGALFEGTGEHWGGLFFGGVGLLVLAVPVLAWRGERQERHPLLEGVALSSTPETLRRGDEVTVAVTQRPASGRMDVGIGCDERFDTEVRTYSKGGGVTIRETGVKAFHEDWQAFADGQTFTFRIPADAPYSYEGDCLSYAWRISARVPRRGRKDARYDVPIWVEP
jgi:hypothetical protein